MTCRDCEKISEPPAPFHVTPRGWAGPNLMAMLLNEKFGQHQPLNRQAERYAREGVPLSLSTLADQIGAGCAAGTQLRDWPGARRVARSPFFKPISPNHEDDCLFAPRALLCQQRHRRD
jgi:transposase